MKICVVCQKYPSESSPEVMAFVHARNLFYVQAGHEVHVLNFSAREKYTYAGVDVRTERTLDPIDSYDVFVFHSPNLRGHLRFVLKHGRAIRAKVFVAHGHEFIDWKARAAEPYPFMLTPRVRARFGIIKLYDRFKIAVWSRYLRLAGRTGLHVIFVSRWLRAEAEASLGLQLDQLARVHIVKNPVHPAFLQRTFAADAPKVADFITIRPLDDRKYAVDVVVETARRHPQYTFHLFGRGAYFDLQSAPPNLKVEGRHFKQADLPALFDRYRAALLPTRWDSQGVLMCEMATYGMPVWVSDLPVCRDMVGAFPNVRFLNNDNPALGEWPTVSSLPAELKNRYDFEQTVARELEVLTHVTREAAAPKELASARPWATGRVPDATSKSERT